MQSRWPALVKNKKYTTLLVFLRFPGFNADAIGNPDSEWVHLFTDAMAAAFDPFFYLFPVFDTTLLWMFPRRAKLHQGAEQLLKPIEDIIVEKKEKLRQGITSSLENNEKDLCTLVLEAEMDGSGGGLTIDEIKVFIDGVL